MNFLKQQWERLSGIFSHTSSESAGDYMNPLHDWVLGLSLAVVMFLFGAGFIGYDFYQQFGSTTSAQPKVSSTRKLQYDADTISKLAHTYAEREKQTNLARKVTVVQPESVATTSNSGTSSATGTATTTQGHANVVSASSTNGHVQKTSTSTPTLQ